MCEICDVEKYLRGVAGTQRSAELQNYCEIIASAEWEQVGNQKCLKMDYLVAGEKKKKNPHLSTVNVRDPRIDQLAECNI